MRALYPSQTDVVFVKAEDDLFVWVPDSTETPSDDVILRNGFAEATPGRWHRETRPPAEVSTPEAKLEFGAIADGQYLKRVGGQIVGANSAGGGGVTPRDHDFETAGETTSFELPQSVSAGWEASVQVRHGVVPIRRSASSPPPAGRFYVSGATVELGDAIPSGRVVTVNWLEPA
jgi:hypothetical protein